MSNLLKAFIFFLALGCLPSCHKNAPEFEIGASSKHILVGQSITFSVDPSAGDASWVLEGSSSPNVTGTTVSVTYNTAGIYKVFVTVSHKGQSTTREDFVIVENGTWTFSFPGLEPNNNQTVGDFCCTGQTATVLNFSGKPLGYAYFYTWQGDAYNLPDGSVAPNFEILVSGSSDLDGSSPREKSSIFFPYDADFIGKTISTQVGNLLYTAKILDIAYPLGTPYANTHFLMASLKVELKVRWVP